MKIVSALIVLLAMQGCVQWQHVALYDVPQAETIDDGLHGFSAPMIWQEQLTSEVWVTPEKRCIEMQLKNDQPAKGQNYLHLKWNKQAGGCPWLGMGFGWDGWSGKDLSMIVNDGMLSFQVKSYSGKPLKTGLPGALGFEDFAGNQSFVGMFGKYVVGGAIGKEWVAMQIPLKDILAQNPEIDATAIKQLIFTLESEGEIGIDEMVIQPINPKQ
jgi:hypothetical protein